MVRIVVIHGSFEHFTNEDQLRETWQNAIGQGLKRAEYDGPAVPVSLAFYGDTWRPDADIEVDALYRAERAAIGEQTGDFFAEGWLDDRRAERAAIGEQTGDFFAKGWLDDRRAEAQRKLLAWLGRIAPDSLTDVFLSLVYRDLHQYLTIHTVAEKVLAKVVETVNAIDEPFVLVGHSMGSLVGYEYLLRHGPNPDLGSFITVGSPLGIEAIRNGFAEALRERAGDEAGRLAFPSGLPLWYNVYDRRDAVTGDGEIAGHFRAPEPPRTVMDRVSEGDSAQPHYEGNYASSVTFGVCLRALLAEIDPPPAGPTSGE